MYRHGEGVPLNHKISLRWYTLAANQGNAKASLHLAYLSGGGHPADFPQDDRISLKWYKHAAERGHTTAQTMLAFMYGR